MTASTRRVEADRASTSGDDAAGALLTVTIDGGAAVFGGLSNVRRYDKPTTADIAAYIGAVLGEESGDAHVHATAAPDVLAELERLLSADGIRLTTTPLTDVTPSTAEHGEDPSEAKSRGARREPSPDHADGPPTRQWSTLDIRRPSSETRRRQTRLPEGAVLAAVVCLVASVSAAAIWAVAGRGADDPVQRAAAESSHPPTPSSIPPHASIPRPSSSNDAASSPTAPATVTLEQDGLRVDVPVGFQLAADGDMWRATGPDPDFRLQIAVDPLYGVAPLAVIDQVEQEINDDPELTFVDRSGDRIRYRHVLPDGSQALWSAWAQDGNQISIGCHTRTAPTTVQLAACAMANDSARFTPP